MTTPNETKSHLEAAAGEKRFAEGEASDASPRKKQEVDVSKPADLADSIFGKPETLPQPS